MAELLANQTDPASGSYQRWLTPDEFGARFGASDADIQTVTSWLQGHGFTIDSVSRGRTTIQFSGTAQSVAQAFHTEVHKYVVEGVEHWANETAAEIPAALTPAVAGVVSLHNFVSRPQIRVMGQTTGAKPNATFANGQHALAPGDFATIYNSMPLYYAGYMGAGRTITVLGRSNFNGQDVADFRRTFGLSNLNPVVIVNGADPGDLGGGEEAEAVLDNSWAGAIAPTATVNFILSASTSASDGIFLSEQYAIDHNIGDVITSSFGSCEALASQAEATAVSSLAQQAAAQGQTMVVSSGDSGSAGCDAPTSGTATHAPSANLLASTPYTIAVGGTEFNENGNAGYWNSSNASGAISATGYIPEAVWNDSSAGNLYASGGGASIYFAKPYWQAHAAGIPLDGARDIPDVAFNASASHDGYLLCLNGSCANGATRFAVVGGTSVSAPTFAAIMALVDQKNGARQGQAAPVLYRLAGKQNDIFHDVTAGSNAVPGASGYAATPGYDLATGLGSVNAYNLVNEWQNAGSAVMPLFTLTNTNSGFVLDVAGGGKSSGTPVLQWQYWQGPNQQWQFVAAQPGWYELVNSNSGLALSVSGNGNAIVQSPYGGTSIQQWGFTSAGNGTYTLKNRQTGLLLDMQGGVATEGAPAVQNYGSGGASQVWQPFEIQ